MEEINSIIERAINNIAEGEYENAKKLLNYGLLSEPKNDRILRLLILIEYDGKIKKELIKQLSQINPDDIYLQRNKIKNKALDKKLLFFIIVIILVGFGAIGMFLWNSNQPIRITKQAISGHFSEDIFTPDALISYTLPWEECEDLETCDIQFGEPVMRKIQGTGYSEITIPYSYYWPEYFKEEELFWWSYALVEKRGFNWKIKCIESEVKLQYVPAKCKVN
jgi:hypothetical protein